MNHPYTWYIFCIDSARNIWYIRYTMHRKGQVMHHIVVEAVFDALCGEAIPEACVPGVENAFAPGSPCDSHYEAAMAAYARLRHRLCSGEEDEDVECILTALRSITRELCLRMFICGAAFGAE